MLENNPLNSVKVLNSLLSGLKDQTVDSPKSFANSIGTLNQLISGSQSSTLGSGSTGAGSAAGFSVQFGCVETDSYELAVLNGMVGQVL